MCFIAGEWQRQHITKQLLLSRLVESYLFKDILAFQPIRYSQEIVDLARALAYQIGNEVNEIGDFDDLSLRPDRGVIWENFLIIERRKAWLNQNRVVQGRFWRTYNESEVDYIEEVGAGKFQAFELKFGSSPLTRGAQAFERAYAQEVQLVNQENYLDFALCGEMDRQFLDRLA